MTITPLVNWAQNPQKDTSQGQAPTFKKGALKDSLAARLNAEKQAADLKQKAAELKSERKSVRKQTREQWVRDWQEQSTGKLAPQTPPIWGQTPLQQQQMAVRDRKRQLQWQQQQAQRAQREQQLKFEKQQAEKAKQQRKPAAQ